MKTPTKYQQIFLYTAPFVPLAFFKIWASTAVNTGNMLTVACAMLVCCFLVLAIAWRWDKPTYFDWTISAYFLTVVILLFLWPEPAGKVLHRYAVTGIYLCLFSAAFLPAILGFAPFTLHYARKWTPPILWENPIFLKINRTMTFTWAGIFAICIILSLYPSVITRAVVPISLIVGVGVPFNIRFPDHYLRRLGLPPLAAMREGLENTAVEAKATLSPSSQDPAPDRHDQPVLNNNQKETPMEQRNPIPRPDSIESFMTTMSRGFKPESAGQMKAVMQFNFSGEVEGSCHFEIENGEIRAKEGTSAKPDLIIVSPFEIWMDVITGKADGQQMFMQAKYTASGDFSLLMRMNQLFGRD
ncbi:MAG: SCP2 sterol-binding domain-containing protein [Syntrophobacteraceae bacterium]